MSKIRSVSNLFPAIPTMAGDYMGSVVVVVVVHLIPNGQMVHQKNEHLGNGFGCCLGPLGRVRVAFGLLRLSIVVFSV